MKIEISDKVLENVLTESAKKCNCSIDQIIINILWARISEYFSRGEIFNDPKKSILPELITRNGELLYKGAEAAVFIANITKGEFSQIKAVNDHLENIDQENFEREIQGGNA